MKKTSLFSIVIVSLFLLTACGAKSSTATGSTAKTALMAPAYKLAAGTLNLEGTSQSIDSKSAAQLLPLWQLLDELNTNDAAAPQEITAVVASIQAAMTAEQIKAIQAMQVTPLDVVLAAQGTGSSSTAVASSSSGSKSAQASSGAVVNLTGAGGPPMDGGVAGGPGPGGNSQQRTSTTSKTSSGTGSTSLIKQVIQLLQSKIQS